MVFPGIIQSYLGQHVTILKGDLTCWWMSGLPRLDGLGHEVVLVHGTHLGNPAGPAGLAGSWAMPRCVLSTACRFKEITMRINEVSRINWTLMFFSSLRSDGKMEQLPILAENMGSTTPQWSTNINSGKRPFFHGSSITTPSPQWEAPGKTCKLPSGKLT